MFDLACSLALLVLLVALALAYLVRVCVAGRVRAERVERVGASALLGKTPMEMAYWALTPLARALCRVGVSAAAVTVGSLALALCAGVSLALGHFGLAALLAAFAGLGDALDGLVARLSGSASNAGAVLDSSADRYAEFFFLGGLAMRYRANAAWLALVLLALLGSFMVSYSTAKAEALGVEPPRGAMRRHERVLYLSIGAWSTPLLGAWHLTQGRGAPGSQALMITALALVAAVGNVSALLRLRATAIAVRSGPGVLRGRRGEQHAGAAR